MYDISSSQYLLSKKEGYTTRHIDVDTVVEQLSPESSWHMRHKPYQNDYPAELVGFGGKKIHMNRTTKIDILAYASEPDKNYNYDGDIVEYKGKRYFVDLAKEQVEFVGIVKED